MKAFEAALASLVPRTDRLDRDRLMFLSGRASVVGISAETSAREGATGVSPVPGGAYGQDARATRQWAWPGAFAAMTALAATLLVIVVARPGPRVVVQPVPMPAGNGQEGVGGIEAPGRSSAAPEWVPQLAKGPDDVGPGTLPSAPPAWSDATALAMAPLWRVRSPELAQRMSTATLAEVLDTILPQAQQAAGTPDARPVGKDKSSYHDLRVELLEKPGRRDSSPRPSVLELFPPLGARS